MTTGIGSSMSLSRSYDSNSYCCAILGIGGGFSGSTHTVNTHLHAFVCSTASHTSIVLHVILYVAYLVYRIEWWTCIH